MVDLFHEIKTFYNILKSPKPIPLDKKFSNMILNFTYQLESHLDDKNFINFTKDENIK